MADTTHTGAAAAALSEPTNGSEQPTSGESAPAPIAPAATPENVPDWAKGWDPEELGAIQKKGWRDPREMFKSYRELERTLGQDKIPLPKEDAAPEDWDKVYAKLGRPDKPDQYVAPKGADADMFKTLAPELHTAGLTQKQVDKITEGYNRYLQAQVDKQQTAWIDDQNAAQAKLEREWGTKTPAEIEHNRRAMRALGISVEDATAYMRSGSEKFLRLLNMAGHMIAEDNSGDITSDDVLGFGLTPNRAAAELAELKANKDFMARLRSGEHEAKAKYDRLLKITAEGGLVKRTIKAGFQKVT